jgi:hypothetical protein
MKNPEIRRQIDDLKIRIPNLLQDRKRGLTLEQLKKLLKEQRESYIRTALLELIREEIVVPSGAGWMLKREEVGG